MIDDPALRRALNEALAEPAAEPLAQWLNITFAKTEDLLAEVAGPAYRFLSKEDVMEGLGINYDDVLLMAQIGARLQLIAANIDSRKIPALKVIHGQAV